MEGMLRICIEIDESVLAKAAEELETSDAQETVSEAIRVVKGIKGRCGFVAGVSRPGFFETYLAMERAEKALADFVPQESD